MKSSFRISDTLDVELKWGRESLLWISRRGGARLCLTLAEARRLVHRLNGLLADLIGYRVGDHIPITPEEGADAWRSLVGRTVRVPDGELGTVMGPVGDWAQPHERYAMLVCFPDRLPQVYHLSALELVSTNPSSPPLQDTIVH